MFGKVSTVFRKVKANQAVAEFLNLARRKILKSIGLLTGAVTYSTARNEGKVQRQSQPSPT